MIVWAELSKEERHAYVGPLWIAGKSAAEIAETIDGATRNAVIGIVRRMGLHRRETSESKRTGALFLASLAKPKPIRQPAKPKLSGAQRRKLARPNNFAAVNIERRAQALVFGETKVKPAYIIAGSGAVIEKPPGPPPRVATKAAAFAPIPGSEPVPWTLRGFGCAWPVDVPDAEEQHSCGLETGGATYCAAHIAAEAERSAQQNGNRRKTSGKELARALRRWAA